MESRTKFLYGVRFFLEKNKIDLAINSLLENISDDQYKDDVVLFSSRLQFLNKQFQKNIIDSTEFQNSQNKLIENILNFCREFESEFDIKKKSSIKNAYLEKFEELIKILELRAKLINLTLKQHCDVQEIDEYLNQFNSLHKQHIRELKKNNMIVAHEILGNIHNLSRDLEIQKYGDREIVKSIIHNNLLYAIDPLSKYKHGAMIKIYQHGKYDNMNLNIKDANNSQEFIPTNDELKIYKYYLSLMSLIT